MQIGARPSHFEATTARGWRPFEAANIDVAVLEVELGGRLDATNTADASLAVITNIGLDIRRCSATPSPGPSRPKRPA